MYGRLAVHKAEELPVCCGVREERAGSGWQHRRHDEGSSRQKGLVPLACLVALMATLVMGVSGLTYNQTLRQRVGLRACLTWGHNTLGSRLRIWFLGLAHACWVGSTWSWLGLGAER